MAAPGVRGSVDLAGWLGSHLTAAGSHFGEAIPARINSRSLIRKGTVYVKG